MSSNPNPIITEVEKTVQSAESAITTNPVNSNNLIKDEPTLDMLKGLSFWTKFYAVIMFIGAGFYVLGGLLFAITIIGIVVSVFYWAIAGLMIWLGTKIWSASESTKMVASATTQDEFNSSSLSVMSNFKTYYKTTGILFIVSLVLGLLLVIGLIALLATGVISNKEFLDSPEFRDAMRGGDSSYNMRDGKGSFKLDADKNGININISDKDAMMDSMTMPDGSKMDPAMMDKMQKAVESANTAIQSANNS
jgi:Family of unknown function (DUF5362)